MTHLRAWQKALVGVLIVNAACWAWGNYRWHKGFEDGADTAICVIAHNVDGAEAAMQSRACQAIEGKKPPYFPGE